MVPSSLEMRRLLVAIVMAAWFWNQRSNQVLKLTSKEMPRIKPEIRYVPAQDRYLAFETEFVARLPAFNDMVEAKGCEVLSFE